MRKKIKKKINKKKFLAEKRAKSGRTAQQNQQSQIVILTVNFFFQLEFRERMSIHPRLKVSVGSNNSKSDKINKLVKVNSSSTLIENELFGGSVFVKLVDYLGPNDNKDNGKPKPDSISTPSTTFSIMIQGRFKDEPNGNDIVFGNVWNHPIKQWLPYGTSAAVKFAETVVDPTLETDLYSDEPWALSPFLSTMNLISVSHLSPSDSIPEFKGELIKESISELFNPKVNNDALDSDSEELKAIEGHADKRRKYMALKENREKIILTKDLLVSSEKSSKKVKKFTNLILILIFSSLLQISLMAVGIYPETLP